jgi:hypothetical protein
MWHTARATESCADRQQCAHRGVSLNGVTVFGGNFRHPMLTMRFCAFFQGPAGAAPCDEYPGYPVGAGVIVYDPAADHEHQDGEKDQGTKGGQSEPGNCCR